MKQLKNILLSKYFYIILIIISSLYIFFFTYIVKYQSIYNNINEITGKIIEIKYSSDKYSFIIKNKEKIKCTYYLKDNESINYDLLGKYVKVIGNEKELKNNTIPSTFNYKKYLYNNKIYKSLDITNIEIIKNENIFYKIKNKLINKINTYNDNIKGYLNIFVLGDSSYLDDNYQNNYLNLGIWHLFSISGMHISLLINILNKLLKRIKYKNIVISLFILYFGFLTGFKASFLRVSIFYYLSIILSYFGVDVSNIKKLIITFTIIIIMNPFIIYNSGFQYSFIIVLFIFLNNKKIKGNYFKKLFTLSFIAYLASLPISVNMNYEINILSILFNLFYVPLITFIVFPLSIILLFIPIISPFYLLFIKLLEYTSVIFNYFNITIIIPKMNILLIIIYYLVLFINSLKDSYIYIILIIIILFINKFIPKFNSNMFIVYLDVGQGDSSIIITPYQREVILIDTGGNIYYDLSNNIIDYLKSIGIGEINTIILSHGDFDHVGWASNIINNYKVNKVIFNCGTYQELEQDLIKLLDNKNIKYYSCINELNIDKFKLYFLNTKEYDNENDNSNVVYLNFNNYKFLFMGDAGITKEQDILNKYNLKNIDFLKVGHHGSNTSSSELFISRIKPKNVVISVGINNRYGHPKKEVLDILKNSHIYRTDLDGSIEIKLNKSGYNVRTCPP